MPEPPGGGAWPPPAAEADAPAGGAFATRLTGGRNRAVAFGVAVIVIAALVFVLLSSTSGKLDPVAQAAVRSSASPGYRARLSMQMNLPGVPSGITMSGGGVIDLRSRAASMSMTMTLPNLPQVTQQLGGTTAQFSEILSAGKIYVQLPGALAGQLASGKKWISINLNNIAGLHGLSSLGGGLGPASNPSQFLEYLRAASDSVVKTGNQQVDGYNTTHYVAQLDVGKVLNTVPAADRATVQQGLKLLAGSGTLPIDVWIDSNHLVRRIKMAMNLTTGGQSVTGALTEDLFDYGPQATPAPPPADQVQSIGG